MPEAPSVAANFHLTRWVEQLIRYFFLWFYVSRFLTDSKDFFFSIYISVQWRFPSRDIDGKDDGRHDGGYNCVFCHQGGMKWRKKCSESKDFAEMRFLIAKKINENHKEFPQIYFKINIILNWWSQILNKIVSFP